MPGRAVDLAPLRHDRRIRGLVAAAAVGVLTLLAIGAVIGARIGSTQEPMVSRAAASTNSADADVIRPGTASARRTRPGAVSAAARSIAAFDGDVLLDPVRLRTVVSRIASRAARGQLILAFNEASAQTRAMLGADTVPRPVIVLRSVPVGYRVERFSPDAATVSVWYVGIVGSGATVQPQQSWRTQLVELVWEAGTWRVSSFASTEGPTPPLSSSDVADAPGDLFAEIPSFEGFDGAQP
jgi:hypothetical protein